MELYLIRHAQSANNARPDTQREADPPLTDLGREQARRVAASLAPLRLSRLLTSPFLRTLQTAEIISNETGLAPEVRIALHEQGGCYSGYMAVGRVGEPGLTRTEIERRFPGFHIEAALDGEGWWRKQPYEERRQAQRRASVLLEHTVAEFAETSERVGLVTHADIKTLFLECFHSEQLVTPYNSAVTKVSVTSDEVRLVDYNRVDHLPQRLRTY